MSQRQPGIYLSESLIQGPSLEAAPATPVFVGFVERGTVNALQKIDAFADFQDAFGAELPSASLYHAVRHYFDNGGGTCFVLAAGTYEDLAGETLAAQRLVDAIDSGIIAQEASITLLAVPDSVLIEDGQTNDWSALWTAMLRQCKAKPDLFALFDMPEDASSALDLLKKFDGADAERGACYWPRLVSNYIDAEGNRIIVPPSGAVAAAVQRTDRERGIWKAPANMVLSHVVKPTQHHLRGAALFDDTGVSANIIRSFAGNGVRIWGCRTLVGEDASPWRYVQVRRLVSYIEATLRDLGRFTVFEPNNEITWLKFKSLATAWLRRLWQSGGLFGVKEEDAYRFLVGRDETMTDDDIRQGKMIVSISLALFHPAEFIEVNLVMNTTESQGASSTASLNKSRLV